MMKTTARLVRTFLAGAFITGLHAAPGDLDPLNANIVGSGVYATAVQPDGKIIIAGSFSSVLGVTRLNLARLNADGTLDPGFDPRPDGPIYCIAVQADGNILLAGNFQNLSPNGGSPLSRFWVARVRPDGTLDTFDARAPSVTSIVCQPDGKIILAGSFTYILHDGSGTPATRNRIARVNANGSLDTGFDPNADDAVFSATLQPDGKIIIGGYFRALQPNGAASPTTRDYLARLNADGTIDTGFDPRPDLWPYATALQADGKILVAGSFSTLRPNGGATVARRGMARLNPDGTVDAGYDPSPGGQVRSIAVSTDGAAYVSGFLEYFQPNGSPFATIRPRIARVRADGTIDAFRPNANDVVRSVAVQADGGVLICGEFTALQPNGATTPTVRNRFARVEGYAAAQSLTITPGVPSIFRDLTWHRSGGGPEVSRVTFDLSADGGASWSSLGAATRIGTTPDWRATVIRQALPASYFLRARGITTAGDYNGSSGMVETVAGYQSGPYFTVAIPGLYNTGVNNAGEPLPNGSFDFHYNLEGVGAPYAVTSAIGFPIPPWLGDNGLSRWVAPEANTDAAPNPYFYRTFFDMRGLDLATAQITGRWAADDQGLGIHINNFSIPQPTIAGFGEFTPFQITTGFLPDSNSLTFIVSNGGTQLNPSGLRVEMSGTAALDLRIISIERGGPGYIYLTWTSQPGRSYRLQRKDRLSDPEWIDLLANVPAGGTTTTRTVFVGGASEQFFRVLPLPLQ